jgi:tight adherence protein B
VTAATVSLLFLASFVLLMGLAAAALLIDSGNRERQRVDGRLSKLGPATVVAAATSTVRLPEKPAGPIGSLAAVIGCDYPRRHHYPIRWWIVPIVTLIPARVAAWLAFAIVGTVSWAVLPIVWFVLCRTVFGGWDGKRRDRMLSQFPDALGLIVRTVRVGIPVMEGVRAVAREASEPTREEFRLLVEEVTIGVSVDVALRAMAERTGLAEYRFFATAVAVQMQTGGGLSDALDILADVVRKRLALRDRGFALTSEARASAWVLGLMPFFVSGIMMVASPGYLDVLFTTATGNMLLGIGVLSLGIGVGIMRLMIRQTLK